MRSYILSVVVILMSFDVMNVSVQRTRNTILMLKFRLKTKVAINFFLLLSSTRSIKTFDFKLIGSFHTTGCFLYLLKASENRTLRKKYLELFWSAFYRIWTKYGEIWRDTDTFHAVRCIGKPKVYKETSDTKWVNEMYLGTSQLLMTLIFHFSTTWYQRFSDVFRGYRNRSLTWNVLIQVSYLL